jgi:ribosomal protein S18 acetylase RimI-like enzyme
MPSDADAIASVHVESWRAAYPGIVAQSFLDNLSVERRAAFWATVLAEPGASATWVAERGDEVVGFAGIGPPGETDQVELPPDAVELATIYVRPSAMGNGIGRALLDRVTTHLVERGVSTGMLWVFEDNHSARRFYEAAGWQPDGARRDHDVGGQRIPIVRYRRTLGSGGYQRPG